MPDQHFDPLHPKVAMGIAAHPDDLEFAVSGSMAKWSSEGADCYYVILTDGSKGSSNDDMTSEQLIKIRQDEQRAAGKAIGLKDVIFLNYPDAALEVTQDAKRDVVRQIRKLKPEVVISMDPSFLYSTERGMVNHTDHRAAGLIAFDSVFPLARDRLTFPELASEGLSPHKVNVLLLTNFDKQTFWVDISSTFDKKLAALAAHKSQFDDIAGVQKFVTQYSEKLGGRIGAKYAEGFIRLDMR